MRRFCSIIVATLLATTVIGVQAVSTAGAAGGGRTGVSGNEIKVGGLASPPNVLNVPYEDGFAGAKAYFDLINSQGGVFGKKFKIVAQLSDQASPSGNIQAAKSLIAKHVFAIVPVSTNSFASGFLISKGSTPAFGYNIDAGYCGTNAETTAIGAATPDLAGLTNGKFEQCSRTNVFGQVGSFLCFACPSISPAVLAKQLGVKHGAILTYTAPQSTACGDGDEATFKKYGVDLAYEDRSLQFGFADASSAVQAMKKANVDYVVTCMDFGGAYKISQEMRQAGMTGVKFYAPEGYRETTLEKYGKQLQNWYFRIGFVPWESKPLPKGTKLFLQAMKKVGVKPSEQAQAGWMNAMLLVAGIKLAGKNFTQKSVVNAINHITDWTAEGMVPPINWTTDGHGPGHEACDAYVKADVTKFVPVFGKPGQPFVCYPDNPQPANLSTPYYRPLKPGETPAPGAATAP